MGISKYESEDSINGIITIMGFYKGNQNSDNSCSEKLSIRIDTRVTPIFCTYCNKQAPGLYKLNGSRYGQVGNIECERCQSSILVTDTDNIVDRLFNWCDRKNDRTPSNEKNTALYTFDYSNLYYLDGNIFEQIEKATGFQLVKAFEAWADLAEVIESIGEKINLTINDLSGNKYFSDPRMKDLPEVIHMWFLLLTHLGILIVKDQLCYLSEGGSD